MLTLVQFAAAAITKFQSDAACHSCAQAACADGQWIAQFAAGGAQVVHPEAASRASFRTRLTEQDSDHCFGCVKNKGASGLVQGVDRIRTLHRRTGPPARPKLQNNYV